MNAFQPKSRAKGEAMHLMIPGAGSTVESFCQDETMRPHLGFMVTPNTGNSIKRLCGWGIPRCADNAAASRATGSSPCAGRSRRPPRPPCSCASPTRWAATYLFDTWYEFLEARGVRLPWAFVLQNGIRGRRGVPWDRIADDDDFKEDMVVTCELIPAAHRLGKWVHMGRVNDRRRLRLALHADVDSVDGSSLARFSRTWIPKFVADVRSLEAERDRIDALAARLEAENAALDRPAA
jgi:hypothetical protein